MQVKQHHYPTKQETNLPTNFAAMQWKSALLKPFIRWIVRRESVWKKDPLGTQDRVFRKLMKGLARTQFGREHSITESTSRAEYSSLVPIRSYEELRPWVDRIISGEKDVLWKGKPVYFAKTSGTTSGAKFIPITKDSISNHIGSARNALFTYAVNSGNYDFFNRKLIFLSGSPVLEKKGGILTGRLSGISNHHVPAWLKRNQVPSWGTNCIEDWEVKVGKIADETIGQDLGLISGIPPWVQMYFDIIQRRTNLHVSDVFPNLSLFVYGGVNFEPYRDKIEQSLGKRIDSVELFPASEGFFAYQDELNNNGLQLMLNDGIYYEFVPMDEYGKENSTRLSIHQVKKEVNYGMIINSNAGLWGYELGDTVRFTSLFPHKVKVTGRVKHFISAFGEHVIGEEVDDAMLTATSEMGIKVSEFTVAPQVSPKEGELPYHEWFVEFDTPPSDLKDLERRIDELLCSKNSYYCDLIDGQILQTLKITPLEPGGFVAFMKGRGKLGGQNKVPRLSNDRKIADELQPFIQQEAV